MSSNILHFFAQLINPRPTWPEDITPDEEKIMTEHFHYLSNLARKKKVLMAGPCFNPVFGLIILQVESEAEALEILNNDPSVKLGVNSFKYQPMRVSFMAEYHRRDRYVAEPCNKILHLEVTVPASVDDVWNAWTTTDGIKSFFSDSAKIELRVGGPFEVYFNNAVPYGLQGSEDCRILSFLPYQMLTFEWNAPPEFGELRNQLTRVVLFFEKISENDTRVILSHLGWGTGADWDKVFDYFNRAWSYVLANLKKRFIEGPIID